MAGTRVVRRLAGLLALGLLATPHTALADDTIATVSRPTPLSAYAGRLAWSSYDPATREYALMISAGGVTSAVPVGPRSVPFDVDLGPDRNGDVVAVYSRCRHDPPRRDPAIGNVIAQLPDWARGRGCDLYRFDFESGRETPVASANSPRASEFMPSIWRSRIAFARVRERRKGLEGVRPYLYVRSLRGARRSRRLPGGSRSTQRFCTRKPRRCRLKVEPGPTALDLRVRRLAFGWDSGGPSSTVYLDRIRARSTTRSELLAGISGSIQAEEMVSPAIGAGDVFWGFIRFGNDTSSQLLRHRISTRTTDQAPLPLQAPGDIYLQSILATAVDGPLVFYLASGLTIPGEPCTPQAPCQPYPGCSDTEPCKLLRTRDLAFTPFKR
jgi:hypothetical protein